MASPSSDQKPKESAHSPTNADVVSVIDPLQSPKSQLATVDSSDTHRFPLAYTHNILSFMSLATLALMFLQVALTCVIGWLNSNSSSEFGANDWAFLFGRAINAGFLGTFIALFGSALNGFWIKAKGRHTFCVINILIYGYITIVLFTLVADQVYRRVNYVAFTCSASLDGPDSPYPGSYAECLEYADKYTIVAQFFVAITALAASISFAIVVASFVKIFKEWDQNTSEGTFSLTIPAGMLSLEVTLRCGPKGKDKQQ